MSRERRRIRFRFDGPTPVETVRTWRDPEEVAEPSRIYTKPRRRKPGRGVEADLIRIAEAIQTSEYYVGYVDMLGDAVPTQDVGRPRGHTIGDWVLLDLLQWHCLSVRKLFREVSAPEVWNAIYRASREAWPQHPHYRLSPNAMSRSSWYRFGSRYVTSNPDLRSEMDLLRRELAAEQAMTMGQFNPNISAWTDPPRSSVAAGDATWIASAFSQQRSYVDPDTGEITRSRWDHDARLMPGGEAFGQQWASLLTETGHPGERVILDSRVVPVDSDEASLIALMAKDLKTRCPGFACLAYDMALSPEHQDRLLRAGVVPLVKVPRNSKKKLREGSLGAGELTLANGTRRNVAIYTVDGQPCLREVSGGKPFLIPLIGGQVQPRSNRNGMRWYRMWHVGNDDGIPQWLRGARVRIRHDTPAGERPQGKHRSRHLRLFPEGDPVYQRNYGLREATESMHAHLKSLMIGKRARSTTLARQQLDMAAYAIYVNIVAALSYTQRTGRAPPILQAHRRLQPAAA